MISAFEITGIILLAIGVGLVVWWYVEAANYDTMLDGVPFAKGANLIYKPEGTDAENTITMSCPEGKQVCVYQATQICTNPTGSNVENPDTDPILNNIIKDGIADDNWCKFNPATTVDLTSELNSNCGTGLGLPVAKGSCPAYVFSPHNLNGNSWTDFCGDGATHFISTYTCQPAFNSDGTPGICNSTGTPPS